MTKHQLQAFLLRESGRRKGHSAEILSQAAQDPSEANLIAATRVFEYGKLKFGSIGTSETGEVSVTA